MLCSQFGFERRCRIVVSPLIVLHSISFIAHFLSSFTNVCFSPVRLVGDTCLRVFFPRETCNRSRVYFPWYPIFNTLNRQAARCTYNSTQRDHVTYIGYVYNFTIRTCNDINTLSYKLVTRVDIHFKHNLDRTANSVTLERISIECHKTKNTTRKWEL